MPVSNQDLLLLSALLDEVLELDEPARTRWLNELDERMPHLSPRVREMLSRDSDTADPTLLGTLPKLTSLPGDPPMPSAASFREGDEIGPYRLLREIGQGGMSVVWSAVRLDAQIKRPVALKLPFVQMSHSRFADRFTRERDILAALTHPNIARLYDAGVSADGQPFLAMEFVEGLPLTEYCDSQGLSVRARITLFTQVLNAVQFAHANLVIHRDLKPSNILVSVSGNVQLLDFGIAKLLTDGETKDTLLTQFGGRALTPEYASPEQLLGLPLTTASDVYSLGVLLFELVTGTRPYRLERNTRGALEEAVLNSEPQRPSTCKMPELVAEQRATTLPKLRRSLNGDLDTILLKSLKKRPEERYASADAFRQDIERYLSGHAIDAKQDSYGYRARKFVVRNRVAVAAGTLISISLLSGLALALWQAGVARQQARIAQDEARTSKAMETFIENIFRANTQNQADPAAARKTTARELLDVGAAQLDSALNETPQAKLGMMNTLISMYDDLGVSDKMMEIARKRLELARKVYGKNDPQLAMSLSTFANIAERLDLHAVSEPAYLEAEQILDKNGDDHSEARALLESALGYFYYSTNLSKALYHAHKGVIAYRAFPPSNHLANALLGEFYIEIALGDYVNAKRIGEQALALANSLGVEANDQLGEIYEGLGYADAGLEDIEAAERNFHRSLDISSAGLGDAVFDQLESAGPLGDFLVATSRVTEGLEVLQRARDLALTITGARAASSRPVRTLMRYGAALLGAGRIEDGLQALDQGEAMSRRQSDDPMTELNAQILDVRALGLIEQGDLTRAERLLAKADDMHGQSGEHMTPYGNRNIAAFVRLFLLSGRNTEAARILDRYWVGADLPEAARPRLEKKVLQAELAAAQGNMAAAADLAADIRMLIQGSPNRRYLRNWEFRASLVEGRAKMSLHSTDEAQHLLSSSVDLGAELFDAALSPVLADAQLALAECWIAMGQRNRAAPLVGSARSIHARHPLLGEHYQAPLRRMERLLKGSGNRSRSPDPRTAAILAPRAAVINKA